MIPFSRVCKIVDKGLKGKAETPTLILKGPNGEKWSIPVNSGADIDKDFRIGEEILVTFKAPNRRLEEAAPVQEPVKSEASTTVLCLLGVPDDLKGKDAVCQACPSLKERQTETGKDTYCELTAIASEITQVTAEPTKETPTESAATEAPVESSC